MFASSTRIKLRANNSMNRNVFILLAGVIAAAIGYSCVYLLSTIDARTLQQSDQPELAWLQQQFNLSNSEFSRVSDLHAAYLPQCRERCRQIDAQNARLQTLIAHATNVTPEIESTLAEAARLRADCQAMMLHHFFQVSQTMPPPQRHRYLAWIHQKTILPNHDMTH